MALISVVIDTNVVVSGIAYPASVPGRLLAAWRGGRIRMVTSRYIVDEVARVLPRLAHAGLSASQARDLADSFLVLADVVQPADCSEPALRDPGDSAVLGTLIAAGADWLVTGDHDLLVLADRYAILDPAAFWVRFGSAVA